MKSFVQTSTPLSIREARKAMLEGTPIVQADGIFVTAGIIESITEKASGAYTVKFFDDKHIQLRDDNCIIDSGCYEYIIDDMARQLILKQVESSKAQYELMQKLLTVTELR